mgnify:CR=1 FL=1
MYTSSFHSTLHRDVNARGQIRRNAYTVGIHGWDETLEETSEATVGQRF